MIGPIQTFVPQLSDSANTLDALTDEHHKPSLKSAAQGFESVFLTMLLKEMRQTLEPGGLFGHDSSDIYGSLFDQFMGQHLAQGKGMGLAQSLIRQLEPTTKHAPSHSSQPVRT